MDKEINLREVLEVLKSKLALILTVTIVFGLAAYAYLATTTTKKYAAEGRILCSSLASGTADSSLGQSAINASQMLSKTVLSLITSDAFLQEVANNLKSTYPNVTSVSIGENLEVSQISDTFILNIKAVSEIPELSVAIVNEISNVAEKLPELLDGGKVTRFEKAEQVKLPTVPVDTRMGLKSLLAAIIGLVLIVLIVIMVYLADDKIKSQQDLINKYNVPIVGIIPTRHER
ncbi:MAG: hypothetical protein DBX47_01955 [Clostridiales bacterium]|nr:MAG: hypothetical protein DBX47_01955 [Clostridiales bacterium]